MGVKAVQGVTNSGAGTERIGFKRVMKALLDYSLIESRQHSESYHLHPVVHCWCIETISSGKGDLMTTALLIVGTATPDYSEAEYWLLQQQLLRHVERSVRRINDSTVIDRLGSAEAWSALNNLGLVYANQGKHAQAATIYQRALDSKEKALGPQSYIHSCHRQQLGPPLQESRQACGGKEDVSAGAR